MKYWIWILLYVLLAHLNANAYTHQYPEASVTKRDSGVLIITLPDTFSPAGSICAAFGKGIKQVPCRDSILQPNPLGAL
jgi:hypothetical protein